jgi:hypothetical protein
MELEAPNVRDATAVEGHTSERRKSSDRRTPSERRADPERRQLIERRMLDRRANGHGENGSAKAAQMVVVPREVSDREKLTEMLLKLAETLPAITNFLASATQHARACQKGDLLMQAMRAKAAFCSLGNIARDGEAHMKQDARR